MGLINIPDIQNLDAATPELWNSRFAILANLVNGSLDANNLATGAVTAPKLATDSVTTGKIMDANVTPAKWYNPYKFKARAATNQNLTDATSTKITFATEDYDTNSNFASSTYTAPVTGFYNVHAKVQYSTTKGVAYICYIYKNGAQYITNEITPFPGSTTAGATTVSISEDVQLIAGDTLEVYGYLDTSDSSVPVVLGHATQSLTEFSGHLISIT